MSFYFSHMFHSHWGLKSNSSRGIKESTDSKVKPTLFDVNEYWSILNI